MQIFPDSKPKTLLVSNMSDKGHPLPLSGKELLEGKTEGEQEQNRNVHSMVEFLSHSFTCMSPAMAWTYCCLSGLRGNAEATFTSLPYLWLLSYVIITYC